MYDISGSFTLTSGTTISSNYIDTLYFYPNGSTISNGYNFANVYSTSYKIKLMKGSYKYSAKYDINKKCKYRLYEEVLTISSCSTLTHNVRFTEISDTVFYYIKYTYDSSYST